MTLTTDQDLGVPDQCVRSVEPSDRDRRRLRRRRRWRLVIGLGVSGVVLAIALLLYAQSEHALIHIYLPMLSHRVGAHVQAAGGSVHLNGRIHLSDIQWAGTDGEPAVQVEQIDLKIQPSTLWGDALPTIDELLVVNPRLRIRVDREGNSNFVSTAANSQTKSEDARTTQPSATSPQYFPSVRLGRLDVKNLVVDYADSTGLCLNIHDLNLVGANMVPGQTGNFDLTLACLVQRPEAGVRQEASLKASGDLTQKQKGQALGWTGSLDLAVQSRLPDFPSTQSMTLKTKTEGSITADGQWNQKIIFEAATPQGPAGHGEGELVWDAAAPPHRASLKIQGIGPEVLNPLLAPLGQIQMINARLDADCRINEDAQGIHFDSNATADGVSFRLGKDPAPAGPVSIRLVQRGAIDPAQGAVRWDACDLTVNPAAGQAAGAADQIKMNGLCRLGKPTNLKMNVQVVSLKMDPYMDWLDRMSPTDQQGDIHPTSPTTDGALIEADITVDQARYRKATLDKVVAKIQQRNGVLEYRIERGKLCGGDVTFHLEANPTRPEPSYTWDATLDGSDVTALMSLQNEATPAAAIETATAPIKEEPTGRFATLLHAITSRAENVVVDISDMASSLKPKPRELTGKVTMNSHGTGRGSGPDLLRSLESETKFEIKDGEIQGFFVLDALAIATRIDTFRTLDFDRSAGVAQTHDGKAEFHEIGVSGAFQKVELTGQYDLVDHSYDLKLQPAIGLKYLDKITSNPFLPHMIRDSQGYLSFPFVVSVQCDSADRRKVMVYPKMPEGLAKAAGEVGETVRGAAGSVIDKSGSIIKESGDTIKKSAGGIKDSVGEGLSNLNKKLRGGK